MELLNTDKLDIGGYSNSAGSATGTIGTAPSAGSTVVSTGGGTSLPSNLSPSGSGSTSTIKPVTTSKPIPKISGIGSLQGRPLYALPVVAPIITTPIEVARTTPSGGVGGGGGMGGDEGSGDEKVAASVATPFYKEWWFWGILIGAGAGYLYAKNKNKNLLNTILVGSLAGGAIGFGAQKAMKK